MKKVLSVLSLIAILGITTPAFAAPGGPAGPGGHNGGPRLGGGEHHISAGPHHGAPPHRNIHHARPHGGITFHTGYPRHSYWGSYRAGYWGGYRCYPRLGWYTDYYQPMPYIPIPGASFSIRF